MDRVQIVKCRTRRGGTSGRNLQDGVRGSGGSPARTFRRQSPRYSIRSRYLLIRRRSPRTSARPTTPRPIAPGAGTGFPTVKSQSDEAMWGEPAW